MIDVFVGTRSFKNGEQVFYVLILVNSRLLSRLDDKVLGLKFGQLKIRFWSKFVPKLEINFQWLEDLKYVQGSGILNTEVPKFW